MVSGYGLSVITLVSNHWAYLGNKRAGFESAREVLDVCCQDRVLSFKAQPQARSR